MTISNIRTWVKLNQIDCERRFNLNWLRKSFVAIIFFYHIITYTVPKSWINDFSFTFMHLADAFIQSDLQCIQAVHLYCQYVCSLGIEPTTFALLKQCSTTEPQE